MAVGAAAGLLPGGAHRQVGAVRTFAFVAAAVVVFAQLLPESLAEIGMPALAVFAVALAIPTSLERLAHRRHGAHHHRGTHADDHAAGLELGYLGLLLHSFGDGVAVGAVPGAPGLDGGRLALVLSIAAHTVPVTALFVVAFASHRGRRSALARAFGFGLAVAAGIGAVTAVPAWATRPFEPWVTAAVAGLLLHVIAHDWPIERVRTPAQRALELLSIVAGLALALLPGHPVEEIAHEHPRVDLGGAFLDLALDTAPALLAGLIAAALLQAVGSRLPPPRVTAETSAGRALRGALIGGRLPVCAWSALPSAARLAQRGLPPALIVAFLLSTPALGLETLAVSVRFLGWPFALARLLAAPLAAIAAALLVASTTRRTTRASEAYADDAALRELTDHGAHRSFGAHARAHFDELLFHTGAWTLVGLLFASYVEIALPAASLAHLARHGLDVVLVSAAALPSYFCASSAAPLAAVLVAKGLSPGGALVGLVLAPAMNVATIAFLARTFGRRAACAGTAGLVAVGVAVAFVVNGVGLRLPAEVGSSAARHAHGPVSFAALALFGLLIARGVWQSGLRAWLASLEDAFAAPRSGPLPVGPHVHELRESEAAAAAEEHRHQATDVSAGR